MQQIYMARDLMEAYFVKGILIAEGVEAVVQGELLEIARGALPLTADTLPSVWVNEHDLNKAEGVMQRYKSGELAQAAKHQPWTCPRCGEVLEGQFEQCWKCGTPRPKEAPQSSD